MLVFLKRRLKMWPGLLCLLLAAAQPALARCIGFVTAGGGTGFWKLVQQGAEQTGAELGYEIVSRGVADESDNLGQTKVIDYVIKQGCLGLVLAPNSQSSVERVSALKKRGIPTVYIDRDLGGERLSVIRTDNYKAGVQAGEAMVKVLGAGANIAVLRMNPEVVSTTQRERGFVDVVAAAGLKVIVDVYLGTRVGQSREKAEQVINAHPDIQGIFTPNESTSLAALTVTKLLANDSRPVHIGFDSHPQMIKAIAQESMYAIVVQNPKKMGYQGVYTLHKVLQKEAVQEEDFTETVLITKENLEAEPVRALIGDS